MKSAALLVAILVAGWFAQPSFGQIGITLERLSPAPNGETVIAVRLTGVESNDWNAFRMDVAVSSPSASITGIEESGTIYQSLESQFKEWDAATGRLTGGVSSAQPVAASGVLIKFRVASTAPLSGTLSLSRIEFKKGFTARPFSPAEPLFDFDNPSGTAAEPTDSSLPTVFALQGNYPNPFNPETRIAFDLPYAAMVSVEVFDVTGNLRAFVAPVSFAPGPGQSIPIRMLEQPSGFYVYRLHARSGQSDRWLSGKMLLLK